MESHPGSEIVEIDGISFKTFKDAELHFGHPPNRIRNRIYKGWSIEKAIKTPFVSSSKPMDIDGVNYPSIRQAARELGIPHYRLRARLHIKKRRIILKICIQPKKAATSQTASVKQRVY